MREKIFYLVRNFFTPAPSNFNNCNQIISLDALRGIAAIAVIFWHYQHFYYDDNLLIPVSKNVSTMPMYNIFFPFYDYGYLAVQLFWIMSGFVFAYVYPAHAMVKTSSFAINRFARLYPLHFITLIIVCIIQYFYLSQFEKFAIYEQNDLYHFILNIGMVSAWGFEYGPSFNAPIWSVSVEILAYICFWISRRWIFKFGFLLPVLVATVTLLLSLKFPSVKIIFQCISCFFIGTLIYLFYCKFCRWKIFSAFTILILFIIPIVLILLPFKVEGQFIIFSFAPAFVLLVVYSNNLFVIIMPRLSKWLGAISYGVYLWQIPIQLLLIGLIFMGAVDVKIFSEIWMIMLFIALILLVSHLSYFYFEKPMRKRLRN